MATHDPRVDAYISRAPEFARPILEKVREAFHAGCPELTETIKWGVPSFEYKGMLGGMAFFKKHAAFGFWKARLMADPAGLFDEGAKASAFAKGYASAEDLPPRKVLVAYVREAKRINDEGLKEPVKSRPRGTLQVEVPEDLAAAFAQRKHARARKVFEAFSPSHRKEYVEWITEARRPETRARRLATTLEWLGGGEGPERAVPDPIGLQDGSPTG